MRNYGSSPLTHVKDYYRRRYGILWDYVPELIALRAGLRGATQLSVTSHRYARVRPQLEEFCHRTDLKLRVYERRGMTKILLSTASTADVVVEDEHRFGALFGYPPCCVDRFARPDKTLVEPFVNGVSSLLAGADPVDLRMNLFLRSTPLHLVRHFPCAIDCPETLAQADALLEAIGRMNPRLHDEILRFNRSPALFLDVCGAGIVFEGTRRGNRLCYTGGHCAADVPSLLPLSTHNTQADCDLLDDLATMLELGDELVVEPDELILYQRGQWLATYPRPKHLAWRLVSFE